MQSTMTSEEAQAWEALLSWCGWALYHNPSADDVANLVAERAVFAEPPFIEIAPAGSRELDQVLAQAAEAEDGTADLARAIHLDHTYLFRMTGQSKTSPYESVYRTDEAIMFGDTLFDVRARLTDAGLRVNSDLNEPEDHAGLEFMLAGTLMGRGAVDEARAFVSEHLLVFAPVYLENLRQRAQTDYYRAVAAICADALARLAVVLKAEAVEQIDVTRYAVGR